MNKLKTWFAEHNVSTHTIAGAIVLAATAYTTDTSVQGFVNTLIGSHPTLIIDLVALCGIILKYSGSHSTQGQVALIASTPPQQVAAAVTAVKESVAPVVPPAPDLQNVVAAAAAKETK